VRELHEQGYRVVALDRVADPHRTADAQVWVELTDHGQVREALTGVDKRHDAVDAVVHLTAVPAPGLTTNAVTFTNNITATYNVFSAARSASVRNVDTGPSSETRPRRGPGRRRPVCRRIGRVRHSSLHISMPTTCASADTCSSSMNRLVMLVMVMAA
jgi:nucleoside-diphosphate-sugar epimerase